MSPNLNTVTDRPENDASTIVVSRDTVNPGHPFPEPDGYELREQIGKGGMGIVYRARDCAMNREVAIKILQEKYAPDSMTAARFVEEAQITGQLQHPGIPAVYEVSKFSDGRPFLAMKLIRGDTLDTLLKSNAPINRLAVFESICQALGYAHAHNVIHRDLKPANIMVGAFGEVQVMDWGLAKVLTVSRETKSSEEVEATEIRSARGTDSSATQDGSVLGTPAYMPPEQAAGEIDKIDQRSDVFGLGAILCVLLTGKPPYCGQDFVSVQLKAIGGETREALARLDQSDAEPGVVALCKQCLSFDPADRPADANAIATIVGNLRREAEERARQAELDRAKAEVFAAEQRKRRRVWLGLAAALMVGIVASCSFAAWANHARNQADQARIRETAARETAERAQQEEAKAKRDAIEQATLATEHKSFLLIDLHALGATERQQAEAAEGFVKMDPDLKLRDVIIRATRTIEGKFANQPLVEAEIRASLGHTLNSMGRPDLAIPQLTRARELIALRFGPDDPNALRCATNLAVSYSNLRQSAKALKLREEILLLQRAKLGPDHPDTFTSQNNLASSYFEFGRQAEALKLLEDSLAAQTAKLGESHPTTLASMGNLASVYSALGQNGEALKLQEKTYQLQKKHLGYDHPHTLLSMTNLATFLSALDRYAEALRLDEAALELRKQKLGLDHPETLLSMNNLASSYADLDRHQDALKLREVTLRLRKQTLGHNHADTLWSMGALADSYSDLGRHEDALKLREETLALRKQKLDPDHPDILRSLSAVALSLTLLGRHPEALKLREETLALRVKKYGADHPLTFSSRWDLIASLLKLKRSDEALVLIREVLKLAAQAEAAGKYPSPKLVPQMLRFMQQIAIEKRDPSVAREAAEGLEKLKRTDAASLYDFACYWAISAKISMSKIDADKAMAWLKKAVAAGWKDRAYTEKDTDLDALRDRPDFKELLETLPKAPPK